MLHRSFLSPVTRAVTRGVAAGGALLLAVTGLTALTATAAQAETGSNSMVSLSVTVSPELDWYTTDTELTFTVSVTSLNAADCNIFKPTLSWSDSTTAWGEQTGPSMTVARGTQAAGTYTFRGSVYPEGCNQDGGQLTVSKTLQIEPASKSISGFALRGNVPVSGYNDYEPEAGVTVALLDAENGANGTPVDSDVTGTDGSYTLTASNATQADADREYKIRFSYPDSTVVYFDGDVSAWTSSTSDWDAAETTRPRWWYSVDDYSGLVTTAPPPSTTEYERACDYGGTDAEYREVETNTVYWNEICVTDPTVGDAETTGQPGHGDALDVFGYIGFPQPTGGDYAVTADRYETSESGGVLTTVLHDDDIYLAQQGVTVDVTVTRTFQGSFVKWVVEVRDAETNDIVDVPFAFRGELGSDDDTSWTGSGAWRVSDDGRSYDPDGDPVLAHYVSASSFDWETEDGDDFMELVVHGGQLSYLLAVLDYSGCASAPVRDAASAIAQAMPGNFGTEPAPLVGECTTSWDPAPVFDELRMGVPFDQTFPVNADLDWSEGGYVEVNGLPYSLDWETLDGGVEGVAPRIRIYGTPTSEGDFPLTFRAYADSSAVPHEDAVRVTMTILPGDGPSGTHLAKVCDQGFAGSAWRDYETVSVLWEQVCLTDPSIGEASTSLHGLGDALDGFGSVTFDQGPFDYVVTADDHSSTDVDGVLTTVIQDDDIVLADDSVVDVTVTRTIQGSFARWAVQVRDSVTGDIVDAPFVFRGNFGSDGDTVWSGTGDWRTTDDEIDGDPVLAHHAVGAAPGSVSWEGDDYGNDQLTLAVSGGELVYTVAVLDYGSCGDDFIRDGAIEIAQAMDAHFGQDLTIAGDCNPDWPLPAVNELRVGTPFDQTFTVDSTALDWEFGGDIHLSHLPDGLDWETLHAWEDGVAPQVRVFGVPTRVGPYAIEFRAEDDWGSDEIELTGTVLAPVQSSGIHLNFGIGDQVGGATADVTGTGLQAGSEFSVVVQSTPQTVGSGTIGADLLLDATVTLPTGLDAGWHSITLNGTFFDGSALTDRLWIKVGADGTLLEISTTAPAAEPGPGDLAGTGADAGGGLALALSLLLIGGLALILRRRLE